MVAAMTELKEKRIDWVEGKPRDAIAEYLLWLEAIELVDNKDDCRKLIELLRSDHIPGPEVRCLIADLFARYKLRRRQGRPATPAYRLTNAEADAADIRRHYRYFRRTMTHEQAVNATAKEIQSGDIQKIENCVGGRRGSSQRMQRRRGTRP
jgi:hypothetical protein